MQKTQLVITIITIILFFSSCKKETNNEPSNETYYRCVSRITSLNMSGISDTTSFQYEGDHLISIKAGIARSEYFYHGDSLYCDTYGFDNYDYKFIGRTVYKYLNDKVTKITQYSNKECTIIQREYHYNYTGEDLIRYEGYEFISDSLVLRNYTDYEYEGGLLKISNSYNWEFYFYLTKTELHYDGTNITQKDVYKESHYTPYGIYAKQMLEYEDDLLIKQKNYCYYNGYEQLDNIWEFTYDNNGNNIYFAETDTLGTINLETQYTYEHGVYRYGEYFNGQYYYFRQYPLP